MTIDPSHPTTPEPAPAFEPVSTTPVVAVTRKGSSAGRWLNVGVAIAVAIAIGGVAFAIGRGSAPVAAATNGGFRGGGALGPGASGQPGAGRGGLGGGLGGNVTISGTVASVDGDTLTITTADGRSVQVTTGTSTTYQSATAANASDVQAGRTVQVQLDFGGNGGPNASATTTGTIGTASSVTLSP